MLFSLILVLSPQGRGGLLFLFGTLSLLLFDNDQSTPPVEHRESVSETSVCDIGSLRIWCQSELVCVCVCVVGACQ